MSTLLHDLVPFILAAVAVWMVTRPNALQVVPVSSSARLRSSVRPTVSRAAAGLHLATSSGTFGSRRSAQPLKPGEAPPKFRDPLRYHRAIYGKRAKIQMWERARALALIVIIVVALGLALSAVLIGIFVAAGFILEALASR